MSSITAAILAGGLGTRLQATVSDRPKVLAMVCGKPFLAYLLDQLAEAGFRHVILMTGHRGDQVRNVFGTRYRRIRLDYSLEESPLGTAGAVRLALPLVTSDPVLVMNGDSICAVDLGRFQAFHRQQVVDASMVLCRARDSSRFGKVEIAADSRVVRYLEKQNSGECWINAGIYLFRRGLMEEIPIGESISLERQMFPTWAQAGRMAGFTGGGAFLDIGTPESYATADEFFKRRAA